MGPAVVAFVMGSAHVVSTLVLGPPETTSQTDSAAQASIDLEESRRLYAIGEQRFIANDAAQAVVLWRRAITLLPRDARYDTVRHRLILRLGYGLLIAAAQTKDRAYLHDGAAMLRRYAQRHQELFGDSERALRERREVYELLERTERRANPRRTAADDAAHDGRRRGAYEGAPRVIRVRKRRFGRTSVHDLKIMALLRSPFTDPEAGLVLTKPTLQPLTPARGLVRIAGWTRIQAGSRTAKASRAVHKVASAAVRSVRSGLRQCFDFAFARQPRDVVRTSVRFTIDGRGRTRDPQIVGADVIDADGTRCVLTRMVTARPGEWVGRTTRVTVPIVFFRDSANFFDEATGCSGRTPADFAYCREL